MKGKKWVQVKPFTGEPSEDNLKLVEFDLPDELQQDEILLQAVYWTVDPYMRIFPVKDGEPMLGEQLCEVIKTRNGKYPIGTLLLSKAGWTTHFISKGDNLESIRFDLDGSPISYTLGALGMPGATAYLSLERAEPKAKEIIAITAASGAVGSLVGQLAKQKGLTTIGFVGSDEKVNYCKNELGYDHVFNYKKTDIGKALSEVAPEGVDIYYDSVGGRLFPEVINNHMKTCGRVLVIGSIANYNDKEKALEPQTHQSIFIKELTVIGWLCFRYYNDWPRAFVELNKLIKEGKLKVKEHKYVGFENMKDAFYGLFKGENLGKAIVKAVNPCTHYP